MPIGLFLKTPQLWAYLFSVNLSFFLYVFVSMVWIIFCFYSLSVLIFSVHISNYPSKQADMDINITSECVPYICLVVKSFPIVWTNIHITTLDVCEHAIRGLIYVDTLCFSSTIDNYANRTNIYLVNPQKTGLVFSFIKH